MEKLQHLKQSKAFLRKVTRYRHWLQQNGKGYLNDDFVRTETANIEYALPRLVCYEQIVDYLHRKEMVIRLLIPGNKKKWIQELQELISGN